MVQPDHIFQPMSELLQLTPNNVKVGALVRNRRRGLGIVLEKHQDVVFTGEIDKIKILWQDLKREQWCFWNPQKQRFLAGFWGPIELINNG